MAFAGNASIMGDLPRFIAHHKLFRGNALHANTTYLIPPAFFDTEFNATSYYHELLLNANNDSYADCPSVQMPVGSFISMFLYAIVCIVGLFGNTLVIYVVLRFSKMQTVTNMYILNLAIADECFLIGIPFLMMTIHSGEWTFGKGMCKAYMVSTSITQFTSSIFLFIMSADRYGKWIFSNLLVVVVNVSIIFCAAPFPPSIKALCFLHVFFFFFFVFISGCLSSSS